ncbi:hypothetical protein SAICODRAFT_70883 [Saitoella complicata NRRL Y-17804]|nr:uncharacterized protein SAICODRAFT_70883 [Saitoella complicata NRRL Y-17804]ODQ53758.1 hypothetical protein SAICODRAFT_70883 [Saitoella complicata NRRL Y-17804]
MASRSFSERRRQQRQILDLPSPLYGTSMGGEPLELYPMGDEPQGVDRTPSPADTLKPLLSTPQAPPSPMFLRDKGYFLTQHMEYSSSTSPPLTRGKGPLRNVQSYRPFRAAWEDTSAYDIFSWVFATVVIFTVLILLIAGLGVDHGRIVSGDVIIFFPGKSLAEVDTIITIFMSVLSALHVSVLFTTMLQVQWSIKWDEVTLHSLTLEEFEGLSAYGFRYWWTAVGMVLAGRMKHKTLLVAVAFFSVMLGFMHLLANQAAYANLGLQRQTNLTKAFGTANVTKAVLGTDHPTDDDLVSVLEKMVRVNMGLNASALEDQNGIVWTTPNASVTNTTVNESYYNVTGGRPIVTCKTLPVSDFQLNWGNANGTPPYLYAPSLSNFSFSFPQPKKTFMQLGNNAIFAGDIARSLTDSRVNDTIDTDGLNFIFGGYAVDPQLYIPQYASYLRNATHSMWGFAMNCRFELHEVKGNCTLVGNNLKNCTLFNGSEKAASQLDIPGVTGVVTQNRVNGFLYYAVLHDHLEIQVQGGHNFSYPRAYTNQIAGSTKEVPNVTDVWRRINISAYAATETFLNPYYGNETHHGEGYQLVAGIAFKNWALYLALIVLLWLYFGFVCFVLHLNHSPIIPRANSPSLLIAATAGSDVGETFSGLGNRKMKAVMGNVGERRVGYGVLDGEEGPGGTHARLRLGHAVQRINESDGNTLYG